MSTSMVTRLRHGLLVLVVAMILAVATTVALVVLDNVAGTSLNAHVYACQLQGNY